jgi:co-chaperonin GroES (HSP10)
MIEPLNEHYLIEVEKTDMEKSLEKHGINVDSKNLKSQNIGKIKQIHSHGKSQLNPGDTVIFKPYGNEEITIGDEEYLFVPEDNIIGRLIVKK